MSAKGYVSAYQDVSARRILRSAKEENNLAYNGMSAEFTFLAQIQAQFVVLIGQLPVHAYQVMIHVPACVVHALQKCWDLKCYKRNSAYQII
jgi:hypothetical protein